MRFVFRGSSRWTAWLAGPPSLPTAALLLAAILLLLGVALRGSPLDERLFLTLHGWSDVLPVTAASLSLLGSGLVACLLTLSAGPRAARVAAAVLVAVLFGGLLVQALKLCFDVARPLAVLGPDLVKPIGIRLYTRAFPSGHSACVAAVAVIVLVNAWRSFPRAWAWRALAAAVSAGLFAGVALSRAVVGAHWPSDLLAGLGFGLATGVVVTLVPPMAGWVDALARAMHRRAGTRIIASLTVLLAAMLWVGPRDQPLAQGLLLAVLGAAVLGSVAWWRHQPGHRGRRHSEIRDAPILPAVR